MKKRKLLLAVAVLLALLTLVSCAAQEREGKEETVPDANDTEASQEGNEEMDKKGTYEGKLFSVTGDSISTLHGYQTPEEVVFYTIEKREKTGVVTFTDTWWGHVIDSLGGELLANNSVSGSTVSVNPKSANKYMCATTDERTSNLGKDGKNPDVIMIFLSINDGGIPAKAAPENEEEANDPTIFSVAYRQMLEKLKTNYPGAEIWCITVPKSDQSDRTHTQPYTDEIIKLAPEMGVRLVNLSDAPRYESLDGLHPTKNGMQTIGDAILAKIAE